MTHKEIFEALLAGKKLTYTTSQIKAGERWITLAGDNLRDQDGNHADGILLGESWIQWQVYEEPNPHTPGTFAWAREEAKRGKYVRTRRMKETATNPDFKGKLAGYFTPDSKWSLENIDATDWEAVP